MRHKQAAAAFAFACACLISERAAAIEWSVYQDERFGTTTDYPSSVFTVRDPQPEMASHGQNFRTQDGRASLYVSGWFNVEDDTPATMEKRYKQSDEAQGWSFDYVRVTDKFFAHSSEKGNRVHYQRCNFRFDPHGIIDCIDIRYPLSETHDWDEIVTRISRSLRAGAGAETQ